MNEKLVTVVIPTHNRKNELKKLLEFYSNFNSQISFIICDSSSELNDGIPVGMEYLYLPNCLFSEKVLKALKLVDTPYTILSADDDFLIENTIMKLVPIIKKKNYSMIQGVSYAYKENFDGKVTYRNDPLKSIRINGSPEDRISKYFSSYFTSLWSMFKTSILIEAFEVLSYLKLKNDNYIEIVIALLACLHGDLFVSNKVWNIRRIDQSSSWGENTESLVNNIDDNESIDLLKIKKMIAEKSDVSYFSIFISQYRNYLRKPKTTISLKIIMKIRNLYSNFHPDIKKFKVFIDRKESGYE